MSIEQKPLPGTQRDPLYPDSGGRPLGETQFHTDALYSLRHSLQGLFESRADVYVATQLMCYYQQGDPSKQCDPDALIAFGVGKHPRLSFRVWEEGRVPDVVFEICSEESVAEDTGVRRDLYETMRIGEYFLFDPLDEYLTPSLQGYRLDEESHYQPIAPNDDGSLVSLRLNARLFRDGLLLRVLDLDTGAVVLTHHERIEYYNQQAKAARQERKDAEQGSADARKRIAQLQAERVRLEAQLDS